MARVGTKTKNEVAGRGARQIIERAAKNNVSDIHIEPLENFVHVRYRRGGSLYTANKLPRSAAKALARYLKQLAGLDVGRTNAPQFGAADIKLGEHTEQVTIATLPVLDGEKITIHLQQRAAAPKQLEDLGLWGASLHRTEQALAQERGLLLVISRQTEPAELTIAAMLRGLHTASLKLAFIGPADAPLPKGIKVVPAEHQTQQLQLLAKAGYNVIAASTIADRAAARQINELAAKHKMLAALPASNAAQGLVFWQQLLGERPTAQVAAIAQLSVRGLCPHCREAYVPSVIEQIQLTEAFRIDHAATMQRLHELEQEAALVGLGAAQPLGSSEQGISQLWRASIHGCSHCDHTGFAGGLNVFEVYQPSRSITNFSGKPPAELRQVAIKSGMISLQVDALIKALRGLIDFPTLLSVCNVNL